MNISSKRFNLIVLLLFLLQALMVCGGRPSVFYGSDSETFVHIGRAWRFGGLIPYRDLFDHKGPLIFFINFIFCNDVAIFVLNIFVHVVAMWFIYKTILLLFPGRKIIAYIAVAITFFSFVFTWNALPVNFNEVYALPLISISLYVFAKYFVKRVNRFEVFATGMAFGSVICLKQNMAGLWIVFGLFILFKKRRQFLQFFWWFLLGSLAIILPFIIYFAMVGALDDCLYAWWIFNFKYSQTSVPGESFDNVGPIIHLVFAAIMFVWAMLIKGDENEQVESEMDARRNVNVFVILDCAAWFLVGLLFCIMVRDFFIIGL